MPISDPWKARSAIPIYILLAFLAVPASALGQAVAGPGRDATADLLARRVAALHAQVETLNAQIAQLQQRISPVEVEINRLTEELSSLKAPQSVEEDAAEEENTDPAKLDEAGRRGPRRRGTAKTEETEPERVNFRTPILREVEKKTPLLIVCKNGSVAILDMDETSKALDELMNDQERLKAFIEAEGGILPAGDFDVKMIIVKIAGGAEILQVAIPKSGRTSETAEAAVEASSKLSKRLDQVDAENSAIQFMVYPDSFDAFRTVRKMLWEKDARFGVNWIPLEHGDPVRIGEGKVRIQ